MDLSYTLIYFQTGVKFIEDQYFDLTILHGVSEINQCMLFKKFPIYQKRQNVLISRNIHLNSTMNVKNHDN